MATVRKHVRNEELKSQMLESMDVAEFDGNVVAECVSRHARLMGRTEIDWEKIRFEDFKFEPDTLQSHKYEIEVGSGYLYFSFAGTTYNIKVDKMAKLVTGWRGHEFGSSYRVANPNAASTSK
jgi:hypothetical protein